MIKFGNSCLFWHRPHAGTALREGTDLWLWIELWIRSKIPFCDLPLAERGSQGSSQRWWCAARTAASGLCWLIYCGVVPGHLRSLFQRQPALLRAYSYSPLHASQCFFTGSESPTTFTNLTQADLGKVFWIRAVISRFRTSFYEEWEQHAIQKKYTEKRWLCHFNSQRDVLAVSKDQHLQRVDV